MSEIAFTCPHCKETFETRGYMHDHIKREHADDVYKCPHCQETFLSKSEMKSHINRTHTRHFDVSAFGNTFIDYRIVDIQNNDDVLIFLAANEGNIQLFLSQRGRCKYALILKVNMEKMGVDGGVVHANPHFRSRIAIKLNDNVEQSQLNEAFKKIHESLIKYCRDGSGWKLRSVGSLIVRSASYEPVASGSSYIPLPPLLVKKRAVVKRSE